MACWYCAQPFVAEPSMTASALTRPGERERLSSKFSQIDWALTAVKAGRHVVAWEVAAGLNGKAKAVVAGRGGLPHGTFTVHVGSQPPQSYVNNNGQIVTVQ